MKNILIYVILLSFLSCGKKEAVTILVENKQLSPQIKDVPIGNILCVDKLGLCDSFFVVINRMEEPYIHAFNRTDYSFRGSFGMLGQGPNDFNFPFFLQTNHSDSLELYDVNLAAFKYVDMKKAIAKAPNAITQSGMPKQIIGSLDLYKGKNSYFGNIDGGMGLFFIYNPIKDKIKWVDFPNSVKNDECDFSVINRITLNEKLEKIVSAMFYYNKVFLYDIEGTLIKEVQIGEQEICPELVNGKELSDESIRCCTDIQATSKNVYLLMQTVKEKSFENPNTETSRITVLDWELNYIMTYTLPHYVKSILVDELQNRIIYVAIENQEDTNIYYFNIKN